MSSALVLMIIRHAEKPHADRPELGGGVDERGAPDDKSLAVRGWMRAGAWATLFGAGLSHGVYPPPDAVYAARPRQPQGASARPAQTAAPIAARLGLPLDTRFSRDEAGAMMDEVLSRSGIVLISWEHKVIGKTILPRIPLVAGAQGPGAWPSDRFDLVLRYDRAPGASAFAPRQLFPRLLDGDSDIPI